MREEMIKKLRVPSLVGLPVKNAALVLKTAGFPEPDIKYAESYQPKLTIVSQAPEKGQIVDSDTVMRITVSQDSMMRFLPAIYQKNDRHGENMLREFLWIFQHVFDSVNDTIDNVHTYFDPYEAPADFLPWLASWIAFTLDDNWPEEKKRYLIKRAMDFYRIRGTVRGIQIWLELFTGVKPKIIENEWPFRGFQIGVHSTISIDSVILPPVNTAHCFIVEFPLHPDDVTDDLIIRIHDIIQAQKPAHATYFLRFSGERDEMQSFGIVIGEHSVGTGEEVQKVEHEDDDDEPMEDELVEDELDMDIF